LYFTSYIGTALIRLDSARVTSAHTTLKRRIAKYASAPAEYVLMRVKYGFRQELLEWCIVFSDLGGFESCVVDRPAFAQDQWRGNVRLHCIGKKKEPAGSTVSVTERVNALERRVLSGQKTYESLVLRGAVVKELE
jgi:hypothetical protein